jgi:hypothetical protein
MQDTRLQSGLGNRLVRYSTAHNGLYHGLSLPSGNLNGAVRHDSSNPRDVSFNSGSDEIVVARPNGSMNLAEKTTTSQPKRATTRRRTGVADDGEGSEDGGDEQIGSKRKVSTYLENDDDDYDDGADESKASRKKPAPGQETTDTVKRKAKNHEAYRVSWGTPTGTEAFLTGKGHANNYWGWAARWEQKGKLDIHTFRRLIFEASIERGLLMHYGGRLWWSTT